MVAQVALSAVLLVGAGLFARTLHNLRASDTGFDKSHLVLAWFDAAQAGYNAEETQPLYAALASRVAALPSVQRASASNRGMFEGIDSASPVVIPGRESGVPMIFVPYRQDPAHLAGEICILARTNSALTEIAPAIRRVGRQVAPRVPLIGIQTADAQVEQSLAADRATAKMSMLFGGLAGVLVLVGLYGLLAYSVECRTGEIGIRTALGATRSDVIGMVFREGSRVVAMGLAAGLPLAWAASRLVAGQLFGVAPGDPITFGAVAVLLASVGIASGLVPAARAARVQPMMALRRG